MGPEAAPGTQADVKETSVIKGVQSTVEDQNGDRVVKWHAWTPECISNMGDKNGNRGKELKFEMTLPRA